MWQNQEVPWVRLWCKLFCPGWVECSIDSHHSTRNWKTQRIRTASDYETYKPSVSIANNERLLLLLYVLCKIPAVRLEWLQRLYLSARRVYPGFGKMLNAAAAERNKEPILAVLRECVDTNRPLNALEISSGIGQHVTHFAQSLRNILWQPSEFDRQSFAR